MKYKRSYEQKTIYSKFLILFLDTNKIQNEDLNLVDTLGLYV